MHDELATAEALAAIVVGIPDDFDRDAAHRPSRDRLSGGTSCTNADVETGESLGSPIEEGSGVYPPEDDEPDVT
jgi:hypothetical protein